MISSTPIATASSLWLTQTRCHFFSGAAGSFRSSTTVGLMCIILVLHRSVSGSHNLVYTGTPNSCLGLRLVGVGLLLKAEWLRWLRGNIVGGPVALGARLHLQLLVVENRLDVIS